MSDRRGKHGGRAAKKEEVKTTETQKEEVKEKTSKGKGSK